MRENLLEDPFYELQLSLVSIDCRLLGQQLSLDRKLEFKIYLLGLSYSYLI